MTNFFPLVKRFQDIKNSARTVLLNEELIINGRSFRAGTIFNILGWREVNEAPYLILSKGSWEGLVNYDDFIQKLDKIEENDK